MARVTRWQAARAYAQVSIEGQDRMDRKEDRTTAILRARLRDGGPEREASVLDISSRGLMAAAQPPPRRGTYVDMQVGRHSLVGQVQWCEGSRFGVRLRERIDVLAVIGNEAGPVALDAARTARGRPSTAARLAYSRQVARGFTFGILLAGMVAAAFFASNMVSQSLAPLKKVSSALVQR